MRITTSIVALCALLGFGVAAEKADAQIVLSVAVAPPPLPVYDQPPIPGPGYIWTPGYWGWDEEIGEYYWVPGAWVLPPHVGLLWTPGYWGWSGGAYVWNAGYWGPTVGFYGGICYGFGYTGVGFSGGYWSDNSFYYNRSVTNISNTTVINTVYNQQVINNNITHISYNGGDGGVRAQTTERDLLAAREQHIAPTPDQTHHQQLASLNQNLRASANNGRPSIAAVAKAGDFSPHNVVAAQAAGGPLRPASLPTGNALTGRHPASLNVAHPGAHNPMATGNGGGSCAFSESPWRAGHQSAARHPWPEQERRCEPEYGAKRQAQDSGIGCDVQKWRAASPQWRANDHEWETVQSERGSDADAGSAYAGEWRADLSEPNALPCECSAVASEWRSVPFKCSAVPSEWGSVPPEWSAIPREWSPDADERDAS